ncbi:hypothetical protein NIES4071_44210 [Calothrix sp. NIES-4071]|nr:hypothetical protein NIES4071_44210 [Calothrix sp. NIES-4071]BAZ58735.1 hypothetical protein NIES4105_44140 [Calothrix sp. NIES-4105]
MGLSKKETRIITVNGTTYKWVVSPSGGYLYLIIEHNDFSGQRLNAGFKYHNTYVYNKDSEYRRLEQRRLITPSLVKSVILLALDKGWKPAQRGLGYFSLWLDEEFPIAEQKTSGIALEDIAADIAHELLYQVSEFYEWRQRLFYAKVGERFEIINDNSYGLKFQAFLDGWTEDGFWFIAVECINFPHIVFYSMNGVL